MRPAKPETQNTPPYHLQHPGRCTVRCRGRLLGLCQRKEEWQGSKRCLRRDFSAWNRKSVTAKSPQTWGHPQVECWRHDKYTDEKIIRVKKGVMEEKGWSKNKNEQRDACARVQHDEKGDGTMKRNMKVTKKTRVKLGQFKWGSRLAWCLGTLTSWWAGVRSMEKYWSSPAVSASDTLIMYSLLYPKGEILFSFLRLRFSVSQQTIQWLTKQPCQIQWITFYLLSLFFHLKTIAIISMAYCKDILYF